MAIHCIHKILPADYVPVSDRESDIKTSFKIRPMNGLQHMEVLREMDVKRDSETYGRLSTAGLLLALKYGLTGWENLTDQHGEPLLFTLDNIGRIPPFILNELAYEIFNRSELGDAEKKT